jgi:hypothetical protein
VLALGCLILPLLVSLVQAGSTEATWSGAGVSTWGAITMLVGGAAAWLGKIWPSVKDLAEKPAVMDRIRAFLPALLGILFATCLLVAFGGVVNLVLAQLQVSVGQALALGAVVDQPKWLPLVLQCVVAATLLIGVMTFRNVNVNRFSMHAVYRNRLTRAFLGSARNRRAQDPFTGFDPQDNTPLSSLLHNANSLFPVINTTLNITAGNNAPRRSPAGRPRCAIPPRLRPKSTRAAPSFLRSALPAWKHSSSTRRGRPNPAPVSETR